MYYVTRNNSFGSMPYLRGTVSITETLLSNFVIVRTYIIRGGRKPGACPGQWRSNQVSRMSPTRGAGAGGIGRGVAGAGAPEQWVPEQGRPEQGAPLTTLGIAWFRYSHWKRVSTCAMDSVRSLAPCTLDVFSLPPSITFARIIFFLTIILNDNYRNYRSLLYPVNYFDMISDFVAKSRFVTTTNRNRKIRLFNRKSFLKIIPTRSQLGKIFL